MNAKELKPFYNVGPGDFILDFLDSFGWTQNDLAEVTGFSLKTINLLINNRQGITPETAVTLEKVFGSPADFWIEVDAKYQIRKREEQDSEKNELTAKKAMLRKYMPVAEMKKKGWFLYDINTLEGIEKECLRIFNQKSIPEEDYNQNYMFCARQTKFDYDYTKWYSKTWFEFAKLNASSFELKITGILRQKEAYDRVALRQGIIYTPAFEDKVLSDSNSSSIVIAQKKAGQDPVVRIDDGELEPSEYEQLNVSQAMANINSIDLSSANVNYPTVFADKGKFFEVTGTVAINEEVAEELELSVMPNPASDFISITGIDGIEDITIYNTLGQVVKTAQVSDGETISIEGLSQGVYMLQSEKSAQTIKFIVE